MIKTNLPDKEDLSNVDLEKREERAKEKLNLIKNLLEEWEGNEPILLLIGIIFIIEGELETEEFFPWLCHRIIERYPVSADEIKEAIYLFLYRSDFKLVIKKAEEVK